MGGQGMFRVASDFIGSLPGSGRLYLGFNADATCTQTSDNSGSVTATITYAATDPPVGRHLGECRQPGRCAHGNGTTALRGGDVNSATGSAYYHVVDIDLPAGEDHTSFVFARDYNSLDPVSPFGQGWSGSLDDALTLNADGSVLFRAEDGEQLLFLSNGPSSFTPPSGVFFSTLTKSGGNFILVRSDQLRYTFGSAGRLLSIQQGNAVTTLTRDANHNVTSITDPVGRVLAVVVDANGHVTSITLPDGRSVEYAYVGNSLVQVTDLAGNLTQYAYDAAKRLTTVTDANGNIQITNVYGPDGRITDQYDALGNHTGLAWDADCRLQRLPMRPVTWWRTLNPSTMSFSSQLLHLGRPPVKHTTQGEMS